MKVYQQALLLILIEIVVLCSTTGDPSIVKIKNPNPRNNEDLFSAVAPRLPGPRLDQNIVNHSFHSNPGSSFQIDKPFDYGSSRESSHTPNIFSPSTSELDRFLVSFSQMVEVKSPYAHLYPENQPISLSHSEELQRQFNNWATMQSDGNTLDSHYVYSSTSDPSIIPPSKRPMYSSSQTCDHHTNAMNAYPASVLNQNSDNLHYSNLHLYNEIDPKKIADDLFNPNIHQSEMFARGNRDLEPQLVTVTPVNLNKNEIPNVSNYILPGLYSGDGNERPPNLTTWPKLVFNTNALNFPTRWPRKSKQFLQGLPKGQDQGLKMNEQTICNYVYLFHEYSNDHDQQPNELDFNARLRLISSKRKFFTPGVIEIWLRFLEIHTGIDFTQRMEDIPDTKCQIFLPIYLFYVHMIDEIIPRTTPTEGEFTYSKAMQSALESFQTLYDNSPENSASATGFWREAAKIVSKYREDSKNKWVAFWAFVGAWIHTSRPVLYQKLHEPGSTYWNHFKGQINNIYALSVENLLDRLSKKYFSISVEQYNAIKTLSSRKRKRT